MLYRERIIKDLEICTTRPCYCTGCSYKKDCALDSQQLMEDALTLLREQEPVEPVLDIDTWKCRNCGHDLEHQEMLGDNVLFHEQYNYCPNCGKKVKWDET